METLTERLVSFVFPTAKNMSLAMRRELLGNKLPEHLKSGGIPPFSGCVHNTNTACLSAMQLLLLFLDFLAEADLYALV